MLYNIYDSATDSWYKRGEWGKPGKPTKIWRQRAALKLSIIYYMDMNSSKYNIPKARDVERQIKAEYPNMYWSDITREAHKRRAQSLPDTFQVYEYTPEGPKYIGILKEWY